MTNVYIVKDNVSAIDYTPHFAAAGFRYATISGLPISFNVTESMLVSHFIHTDVEYVGNLRVPSVNAEAKT